MCFFSDVSRKEHSEYLDSSGMIWYKKMEILTYASTR